MNADLALPHLAVPPASPISAVDALNRTCFCLSLDQEAMARERCPYMFAAQPVFVAATHLERMAQVQRACCTAMGTMAKS
jgi:hypothetical protein